MTILCPRCPFCLAIPTLMITGGTQAFCGTESCPCFIWDPTRSMAENRAHAKVASDEDGAP